ncbi:hypothetical protein Hanom_Chr08g00753901 [Helianthus anomalus]
MNAFERGRPLFAFVYLINRTKLIKRTSRRTIHELFTECLVCYSPTSESWVTGQNKLWLLTWVT